MYEKEIFENLKWLKKNIEDGKLLLEGGKGLNMVRAAFQHCLSLGETATPGEKPEEEPSWVLLSCEMALGNKGPDDNIITDCHPLNFFCCSRTPKTDYPELVAMKHLQERQPVYTSPEPSLPGVPPGVPPEAPLAGAVYTSPYNGKRCYIPYFAQFDPRWAYKKFGTRCPPGYHRTHKKAGCGLSAMAMALRYFGVGIDPPAIAKWTDEKNYWSCGVGVVWNYEIKAVNEWAKHLNLKVINFREMYPGNESKDRKLRAQKLLEEFKRLQNEEKVKAVAVVSGQGDAPFTHGGHYITLTRIETHNGKDFVYFNDPGHGATSCYWKELSWFPGVKGYTLKGKPLLAGFNAAVIIYQPK
jgi:hypothetical protein